MTAIDPASLPRTDTADEVADDVAIGLDARRPQQRLRHARRATRGLFAAFGFATGTWGVHIPAAKAHHGLGEAGLSMALLVAALGAVACLTLAGRLVTAIGTRRAAALGGVALCAGLGAAINVEGRLALGLAMLALGAGGALLDVAINAEGSVLEALTGRKVMSGFHGMFSAGGMAGAALGAGLISLGVPAAAQMALLGAVLGAVICTASNFLLPRHPAQPVATPGQRGPRGPLLWLGTLAAIGLIAEGAMYDWSVLYLQRETAAAPAFAALGYASFSAAMAATRFAGDALRTHVPPRPLMAGSALLAAVSMASVLVIRDPWIALIGFAGVGIGFANVVPVLFMAATKVPGATPATAIAAVSALGYLGFVIGPPLVGGIAHAASLSWGLGVVVLGALLLAWGARGLPD